tara:strand:+ start:63 stop:206 length:144 start_codon:yes stop_codon:yes gene_type:complete
MAFDVLQALLRRLTMSDLCWLTGEQMARLAPYFPKATASHAWMKGAS